MNPKFIPKDVMYAASLIIDWAKTNDIRCLNIGDLSYVKPAHATKQLVAKASFFPADGVCNFVIDDRLDIAKGTKVNIDTVNWIVESVYYTDIDTVLTCVMA